MVNHLFGYFLPHLGQWISHKPLDRPNQNIINQMILFINYNGNFQHLNHQFDAPHWVAQAKSHVSPLFHIPLFHGSFGDISESTNLEIHCQGECGLIPDIKQLFHKLLPNS